MNQNSSLQNRLTWLTIACYGLLLFSAIWWLAALPGFDRPAQLLLDISDWPIDGSHDLLSRDARFLSAIGAGLLAALALIILLVVIPEVRRGNNAVLRGTAIAIITWYIVDSAGCIFVGVVSNAILNTVYATAILIPLWAVSRAAKTQ